MVAGKNMHQAVANRFPTDNHDHCCGRVAMYRQQPVPTVNPELPVLLIHLLMQGQERTQRQLSLLYRCTQPLQLPANQLLMPKAAAAADDMLLPQHHHAAAAAAESHLEVYDDHFGHSEQVGPEHHAAAEDK